MDFETPIMARLLYHKLHTLAKAKPALMSTRRHVLERMLWWCGTMNSSDTNSPSRQISQVEKVILEWASEHMAFFGADQLLVKERLMSPDGLTVEVGN